MLLDTYATGEGIIAQRATLPLPAGDLQPSGPLSPPPTVMKLHADAPIAANAFTGYGEGYVLVNGQRHDRSLVVLPERLIPDWSAIGFESLAEAHFAGLAELGREVILLGKIGRAHV